MRITNPNLFAAYKPLRNHLRHVSIEDAFYVIWAYINHFQFKQPFPPDIEVHPSVTVNQFPQRSIYEWELALIAREIIVIGQPTISLGTKSLTNWNYFAAATNKVTVFESEAWKVFGSSKTILKEMRRIAHRQFPWQHSMTQTQFLRNFIIFNNPKISGIIERRLGMSVQQWYIVGTVIVGSTLNRAKFNVDADAQIHNISQREFDIFLSKTSANLDKLKEIIEQDVRFDDQYLYTLNPLEYYPLVLIDDYYYCPVINFLIWRMTSGLYFDLIGDKSFGHPFGLAFQDYLQELSIRSSDSERTKVLNEQKYMVGKREEDSVDLILLQSGAALFVEAKAKRMQMRSKSQLITDEAMERDLDILASDVVQVYATISDYRQGYYTHLPYDADLKIYPIVITLEEWFLMGEDLRNLRAKVENKLAAKGLPLTFIKEMPFIISSAEGYELLIQILNVHTIEEVMANWFTPDKDGHNFGQHLRTGYKHDYVSLVELFPEDFKLMHPEELTA